MIANKPLCGNSFTPVLKHTAETESNELNSQDHPFSRFYAKDDASFGSGFTGFCLSPFKAKTTILWNVLVNPKKIQKKDVTMKPAIFITPNSIDIKF